MRSDSDKLRAAAERLSTSLDPAYLGRLEYFLDVQDVARALLAGPRWHDKPPVPGLYVVPSSTVPKFAAAWHIDEKLVGIWDFGRVYGPIPEDRTP